MSSFVYFLGCDEIDRVKIGVSKNPITRLKGYFAWCPFPLRILATIEGNAKTESQFHHFFADDWVHSEWFLRTPRMDAVLDRIAQGEFARTIVGNMPDTPFGKTTGKGKPKWSAQQRKTIGLRCKVDHAERKLGERCQHNGQWARYALGVSEYDSLDSGLIHHCTNFVERSKAKTAAA